MDQLERDPPNPLLDIDTEESGRGNTVDPCIPSRFTILALTSLEPSLPRVFGTPVLRLQGFLDRHASPDRLSAPPLHARGGGSEYRPPDERRRADHR